MDSDLTQEKDTTKMTGRGLTSTQPWQGGAAPYRAIRGTNLRSFAETPRLSKTASKVHFDEPSKDAFDGSHIGTVSRNRVKERHRSRGSHSHGAHRRICSNEIQRGASKHQARSCCTGPRTGLQETSTEIRTCV